MQTVTQAEKLDPTGRVFLPAMMVPSFRSSLAIERGVERNILMKTWGGLGDQICAEPTLRYALKSFKECKVSLASEQPSLFSHLPFERVFNLKKEQPIWEDYFTFDTIYPTTHLQWEFMSHMLVNCVDYPSLCAFRCQLPVAEREVQLKVYDHEVRDFVRNILYSWGRKAVVVHPGRHWQSKTFPKQWWDAVLSELIGQGKKPILIGADTDDNRGTVDVNKEGCVELRNHITVKECIWLLQNTHCLLTNDSSPLHMAASGSGWIGYVATCKHPDMITHWRNGQWGWRMQNFGKGGIWDLVDYCPNKKQELSAESVPEEKLLEWLPDPEEFAVWGAQRCEV